MFEMYKLILATLAALSAKGITEDPTFRPRPMVTIPPHPAPEGHGTANITEVAFSVRKAVNSTVNVPTPLMFQEVVINAGEGWNQSSSTFVVPVNGGYFFTFNAVGGNASDFTVALIKNKVHQVTAYGTLSHYEHGSNSAFLELHRGDMVYLELQQGMIYDHPFNETYTTFTGFIVYRI